MRIEPRARLGLAAVALLGALAVLQYWFDERRPATGEARFARVLHVTSGADRGEGSLREALFAANKAPDRVRIVLAAGRIVLKEPLPPLVSAHPVALEAGEPGVVIDAAQVATGPVLEVVTAGVTLTGFAIVRAPVTGLLVRGRDVHATRLRLEAGGEGIRVAAGGEGFVAEDCDFTGNRTGLTLAHEAGSAIVRGSRFARNEEAGLWAVRPAGADGATPVVQVINNRFSEDRIGVVAGNVALSLERNDIAGSRDTGVLVIGPGAALRGNQVRDGGMGIVLNQAPRTVVENNEVSRHRTLGMLVRASPGASIARNRVYNNAFGIALVLGEARNPVAVDDNAVMNQRYDGVVAIGDSPALRRNQLQNNGRAGLSLLAFVPVSGARVPAEPFLDANAVTGNGSDVPQRGEYRASAEARK